MYDGKRPYHSPGQPRHQGSPRRSQQSATPIPWNLLDGGFFSKSECIKPVLLDEFAHAAGKNFKETNVSSSQLRNFYNDMKSLEAKIETGDDFDRFKANITLLKSKVAYAKSRKKVSNEFAEFINKCVAMIKSREDFDAFALCFEAVVGFFYGEGGGKNQ